MNAHDSWLTSYRYYLAVASLLPYGQEDKANRVAPGFLRPHIQFDATFVPPVVGVWLASRTP